MALATARYVKPNEPRVVTTPGGMKSVPPCVGFRGKSRFVGEAASMQSRSNAENTVVDVAFYMGATSTMIEQASESPVEHFRRWTLKDGATPPLATVQYNGADRDFDLRALSSMLFSQASEFAEQQREREGGEVTPEGTKRCVSLAVPDSYTSEQRVAICDAARLANLHVVALATTTECLASSFSSGRDQASNGSDAATAAVSEQKDTTVMFVDIGHTCTSVSIVRFRAGLQYDILATESSSKLGGRNVDVALYDHAIQELAKKGNKVEPRTKAGSSVLNECAKAKKILSSNRESQLFLEAYGMSIKIKRADVEQSCRSSIDALRGMVVECLKKAGIQAEELLTVEMSGGGSRVPCFREAVSSSVGGGGTTKLTTTLSPEAVAQGAATFGALFVNEEEEATREKGRRERAAARKIAAAAQKVRDAELFARAAELKREEEEAKKGSEKGNEKDSEKTEEAVEKTEEAAVEPVAPETSKAEEPAVAAAAAAAAAAEVVEKVEEVKVEEVEEEVELPPIVFPVSAVPESAMTEEEKIAAVASEEEMQKVDKELREIENSKNALESFIYEMQSVLEGNGKYGRHASLLNKEILSPLLTKAQESLWDASDDTSAAVFQNQLVTLEDEFQKTSPDYFAAVKKEKEEEEEKMRVAEKEAEEERKLNGEDDEDHDRRKLKSGDRMRLVMRNKEEATELFKGSNFAHAAARYTKSLGHCHKFIDMTPEIKKEVESVKVSLYLNLAQCYLKLEQWSKVVPNCKDALTFDPDNVKALYRRAYALIKLKQIDEANKDVKLALTKKSDDKSLLKLKKIIDAHIKKAKAKEKKMAQAMFGGN